MTDDNLLKRYYQLFTRCYRGRHDVAAQQQKDGSFKPVSGGFTYERFVEQVRQTNIYGIYNLDDDGKVGFIMYDMDVFPRIKETWEELMPRLRAKAEQVQALITTLGKLGIQPDQVLVEFPTVGYHVVLPLSDALPVRQAKAFGRLARNKAGLQYEMPFYPEEVGGHGDMVRLPLRLNNFTLHRSNFIRDLASFDPASYDETPDFCPLEKLRATDTSVILKALDESYANSFHRVARADEVPPGASKLVTYQGERVLLVNDGGNLYAVAELCPHAEAPLVLGPLQDGVLTCPWHGARFRVATGEVIEGPAHRGIVHHAVRIMKGEIWVGPAQP